jgi:DNA polymerase-3 subunit alpha
VQVKLVNGSRATLLRVGQLRVEPSTALMADLKALLGPTAVAS